MVEVVECGGEADEQISLDVYNAVWPHDAVAMDEVRSFRAHPAARRLNPLRRRPPTSSSRADRSRPLRFANTRHVLVAQRVDLAWARVLTHEGEESAARSGSIRGKNGKVQRSLGFGCVRSLY
jgi:hypothetical protein